MSTHDSIPAGSLVLVTGATGFVASHVIIQLLERGYRVRGTVRDLDKASWLTKDAFATYAGRGDLELVTVADLGAEHAFDDAMDGIAAIVHVASVVTFAPDPHEVVPRTVKGATSILEAALQAPSVRSFVYTSSIVAATPVRAGNTTHVGHDTWNEEAERLAWAPPPYEPSRGGAVYAASKAAAERAVWDFVATRRPPFRVSTVLPALIIGQPLAAAHNSSAGSWIRQLYDGDMTHLGKYNSVSPVDVKDVALVHVAAALDPEVQDTRINVWGHSSSWRELVELMKEVQPQPEHEYIRDILDVPPRSMTADETQALALLSKWGNQSEWKPLRESVADNVRGIVHFSSRA